MADTNDSREKKKSRLRMGMISGNMDGMSENVTEEEPGEEQKRKLSRHRIRRAVIILIVAAAVVAAVLCFLFYFSHRTYSDYTVSWQKTLDGSSLDEYAAFDNYILKYSRDGAACYDHNGEMIWNQSYEMKQPVLDICGEYAVIGDQQGYNLYLFNASSGCTGQMSTTLPITRVQVASQGVAAVILEGSLSNRIVFCDKTGEVLDIEIKTLIDEYGYPFDIALSPDGQQLAVAYIYMDSGTMMNKMVFYNFEVGKSRQDRVVGVFMEYQSAMIGEAAFLGNETACAFADDRLDFYSLKNALSPELEKSITFDNRTILSVFHSNSYAGVIIEGDGSSGSSRELHIYRSNGEEAFSESVTMSYNHAEICGDYFLLYNDTNIQIYDMDGKLLYQGELEGAITKCIPVSRNKLYEIGGQVLSELKLH